MPKMLAGGNRRLTWCPTIADMAQPSLSELNAGIRIECLVTANNFQLGGTDEEEITDPAMCSMSNASVPGRVKYSGEMDFFRYTTTPEDLGWTTFTTGGLSGFLVQRLKLPYTQAWAATQDVQVYEAVAGIPMIQTPDNNVTGYEKFRVHFYVDRVNERAVTKA